MESIKSHCCRARDSATPSLPQLLLSPLATHPSILTLSSEWFLYIAVSISAVPAGQSCRSRLWERCVGNLIWSPRDLSEWSACVCGCELDTGLVRMEDSLCRARKERSKPTGLTPKLMWLNFGPPSCFLRQKQKQESALAEFHFANWKPYGHSVYFKILKDDFHAVLTGLIWSKENTVVQATLSFFYIYILISLEIHFISTCSNPCFAHVTPESRQTNSPSMK